MTVTLITEASLIALISPMDAPDFMTGVYKGGDWSHECGVRT